MSDSPHRKGGGGIRGGEGNEDLRELLPTLPFNRKKMEGRKNETKQTRQHTTAVSRKSAGVPFHHKMEGGRRRKKIWTISTLLHHFLILFFPLLNVWVAFWHISWKLLFSQPLLYGADGVGKIKWAKAGQKNPDESNGANKFEWRMKKEMIEIIWRVENLRVDEVVRFWRRRNMRKRTKKSRRRKRIRTATGRRTWAWGRAGLGRRESRVRSRASVQSARNRPPYPTKIKFF